MPPTCFLRLLTSRPGAVIHDSYEGVIYGGDSYGRGRTPEPQVPKLPGPAQPVALGRYPQQRQERCYSRPRTSPNCSGLLQVGNGCLGSPGHHLDSLASTRGAQSWDEQSEIMQSDVQERFNCINGATLPSCSAVKGGASQARWLRLACALPRRCAALYNSILRPCAACAAGAAPGAGAALGASFSTAPHTKSPADWTFR